MIVSTNVSIGDGKQPTLFAPVVTGGINEISWANNPQNGGFAVTITADVDGTPVTSPLTITEQMDGSTLTITASAENFESVTSTILLEYMQPGTSLVSVGAQNATGSADECLVLSIDTYDSSYPGNYWCDYILDGQTSVKPYIYLTPNGNKQDITISEQFSVIPKTTRSPSSDGLISYRYGINQHSDGTDISATYNAPINGTIANSITGTIIVYDNTTEMNVYAANISASTYSGSNRYFDASSRGNFTEGHVLTVIVNATFNPLS